LSPHKVDSLLVLIVGKRPPEPAFHNAFNEIAVVSRSHIALVSLAIVKDVFGCKDKQSTGIVNFPQHVSVHLDFVLVSE
jgi:hypothetical protein